MFASHLLDAIPHIATIHERGIGNIPRIAFYVARCLLRLRPLIRRAARVARVARVARDRVGVRPSVGHGHFVQRFAEPQCWAEEPELRSVQMWGICICVRTLQYQLVVTIARRSNLNLPWSSLSLSRPLSLSLSSMFASPVCIAS